MTPYLVVLAVGLGSYAFRVSMLVVAARSTSGLPPVVERAARHAVPVSFAALATSALADSGGNGSLVPLLGVAAAVVAVRRTGSPHAALLVGLPVVWLVSAVLP
jgi:branched-subunit amino acid transport protein